MMIDEPFTYIAVAEDIQFFAIMEPQLLANCIKDIYNVCPSDFTLKTAGGPNCIIALFLGKTDVMCYGRGRVRIGTDPFP
jgi:hypothetical protein